SVDVRPGDPLPQVPFRMVTIILQGNRGVTSADLDRFVPLSELINLNLQGTGVDAEAVSRIARLPMLQTLNLRNTAIPASALTALNGLRLHALDINVGRVDDDWAFLRSLPTMRRLVVHGDAVPHLAKFAAFSQLRTLQFPQGIE